MLVEAGPRVLPTFAEELSAYAQKALEKLGVEIHLGKPVTECNADGVKIGETFVASRTIVWAAGVTASPAARWLGVAADRAGRVVVEKDLSAPGLPDVFVVGDTASVMREDGKPVPGIAPAAKQQGGYVAKVIRARISRQTGAGAFPLLASGQPGDDRQERCDHRFRPDQAEGLARLVDLGPCPYLLPDRHPLALLRRLELAVDLSERPAQRPADHPAGDDAGGGVALLGPPRA